MIHCKPGRELSPGTKSASTLILNFAASRSEKLYCSSSPVYVFCVTVAWTDLMVWIGSQKQIENLNTFFFFFEFGIALLLALNSFFFFNFIFKLYNIVLVLPNIEMNPPQVYLCSPSWTLVPPPSPYPPSGLSQCTRPKHPVSCIEPGLATHFIHGIIHGSMTFSQISPPSPSPTESIRLIYTVSFAVSYTGLLLPSF